MATSRDLRFPWRDQLPQPWRRYRSS